ncbi:AMP-binding protein [soil metagenome]
MRIDSISTERLIEDGLTWGEAAELVRSLRALPCGEDAQERWGVISRHFLKPHQPFAAHERVFRANYHDWNVSARGPAPAWIPPGDICWRCRLGRLIDETGCVTEADFRAWALADQAGFWTKMTETLGIRFMEPPTSIVDLSDGPERPRWYPGASLNIADSCLQSPPEKAAIRQYAEGVEPGTVTYKELERLSGRVAAGLKASGLVPGDAVGVLLPMTVEAVAVLLGIIRAGCAAVLVAESFAPPEIAQRFRLGGAKLVITQECLVRRGSRLELYAKLGDNPLPAVLIPSGTVTLRPGDCLWEDFLASEGDFESVPRAPSDHAMILFSSGTTGDPKVIPWSHTTPIKAAADGALYQDIGPEDVVAWPTSPGWMMGPWLIFATLVNGGTIALYDDYPASEGFCRFVEEAGVTVLGLVPSLVLAWRESDLPSKFDWRRIKLFSSTGECSRPNDALYLMSRAGYRPIVEYCGGTEVGGGYLTSSLMSPNAPGVFNTVAYGIDVDPRDEDGEPSNPGEGFLIGPSIGLSTELIGRDHHAVYFEDTPKAGLRRHGDRLEKLPGGFWRVLGRADDTMNLGGIKVSAVEIERVLDRHPLVRESAAVASEDPDGGPTRLVAYVVLHEPAPDPKAFLKELQTGLKEQLNPLFRLTEVVPIEALPRTASNKVMRRLLRGTPSSVA